MVSRYCAAAAGVFSAAFIGAAPAQATDLAAWQQASLEPISLYGEEIRFSVLRDGQPIGSHSVTFAKDGGDLVVDADFATKIRLFGITVYRYQYESTSRWRDGAMIELSAATNDDGDESSVKASYIGGGIRIEGPSGTQSAPSAVLPTDHWNPLVVGSDKVLNTILGRVDSVSIADHGLETVETASGPRQARRFAYSGDLRDVESWYDHAGRWVKLRFLAKDGSTIEYRCIKCGPPDSRG